MSGSAGSARPIDGSRNGGRFSSALLHDLARWRFTGGVDAMAEGTAFFPDEPIPRVTVPLPLAQLVKLDGKPKPERSEAKATWPGRKQVVRRDAAAAAMIGGRGA